jgi:hypothetical protein
VLGDRSASTSPDALRSLFTGRGAPLTEPGAIALVSDAKQSRIVPGARVSPRGRRQARAKFIRSPRFGFERFSRAWSLLAYSFTTP